MARVFAYCDSPTAATGFGRTAKHVLTALHEAGHEIVQLAVNHDPATTRDVPWQLHFPSDVGGDPYGLRELYRIVEMAGPFDVVWMTFDPQVPNSYVLPGIQPQVSVLQLLASLKQSNPGCRLMGYFPIDGGPLSPYEMNTLLDPRGFDFVATMADHVHQLVEWTMLLRAPKGSRLQDHVRGDIQKRIQVIPHAVDLAAYRIADEEERRAAKQRLGFPADCFLVCQMERNQQRKQVWRAFEVIEALRKRHPKADVRLWQHMDDDEESRGSRAGWPLRRIAWRYGLQEDVDVRWRGPQPMTEQEMVDTVYAAADAVLSVSAGEGFQYPIWEALACGRRVVVPNDSARKAWLQTCPGAFLYETDPHGDMFRHGYERRMGRPKTGSAAGVLSKMLLAKSAKYAEAPEKSRAWVAERASLDTIQRWWVERVAEQAESVRAERLATGVIVNEEQSDVVVDLRVQPGMGDLCLMAPALRALRERGESVTLALPRGEYVVLARWLGMADRYQVQPGVPLEKLGKRVVRMHELWTPKHQHGWSDPQTHRTDVVASYLGVSPGALETLHVPCEDEPAQQARAMLRQTFGVDPASCVALACESGVDSRTLPEAYVLGLCRQILAKGLTPVLLGRKQAPIQQVGVLNLTGQTNLAALVGILGEVGAAVCVDSLPMHLAGIMQTPLVAICPLFPGRTRLAYYAGEVEVVEPSTQKLGDETYPPGRLTQQPWSAQCKPGAIMAALGRILDDTGDLGAPKVVTAADLGE